MTQHPSRPPPYLQPRPKAAPTLSDTSGISKAKSATPPYLSRPSSQSRPSSPTPPRAVNFDASTKATRALIRRVFYPDTRAGSKDSCSLDELLPPLTSSNEIDLQLYAIIAIVIKDTVHSWYGKITLDESFVEEVIQIVAHCTRAIEGRLRSVDLEGLVFDELPQLVDDHIRAFRTAHSLSSPAQFRTDPRVVYHDLNPHPALSPVPETSQPSTVTEQSEHETQYRQLLVQSALAILLPTEDLDNACLRTLVADVIAETILGNAIGGKLCEGYFIWGNISKLTTMVKARIEPKTTGEEIEVDTRGRLEKFGLLSERGKATRPPRGYRSTLSSVFWRALQYGYLLFIAVRFIIQGFIAASARPRRSQLVSNMEASSPITKPVQSWPPPPLINYKFFSLVSSILDLPLRLPWLSGSLSLLQSHLVNGPLSVGATDGILDQYIHHQLTTYALTPSLIPPLLSTLRTALFPNASLPLSPPPSSFQPSETQIQATKRICAQDILSLLPPLLLPTLFPNMNPEERIRDVEHELDIWGDAYLNKHFLYRIVEVVVVRILPEMGEGGEGPRELMEGRGVGV